VTFNVLRGGPQLGCIFFVICESQLIAIDYDDTFTADMGLWSEFIRLAKKRGHSVVCVTARQESTENVDDMNQWFRHWDCMIPIVFANNGSKVWTMEQRGQSVDIWIDDSPHALVHGR